MVELALLILFVFVILAIKAILWLQESRLIILVSNVSVEEIIQRSNRLYSLYPSMVSRDILVEFIPIKKIEDATLGSSKKLQDVGYRMFTEREKNIIKKRYSKETAFNNFIVLFDDQIKPGMQTENLSWIQWTEKGTVYSRNESACGIYCAIRIKLFLLGDSMENEFFIAATMSKQSNLAKFLDFLYNIEVMMIGISVNLKNKPLKIRHRIKKVLIKINLRAFFFALYRL